jgi:DNA-binding transcriptional LysR family regulator
LFNQIVRYDSVEAAAKVLKIDEAKINNDLNLLEKSLGADLLLRNHQKVILTAEGKKFADFSRRIIDNFQLLGGKLPKQTEDLVIGSYYGLSEQILPEIVSKFSQKHPEVRLYVLAGVEYVDFTHNDLDVLIGPLPKNCSHLQIKPLKDNPHFLYASADYIKKYGEPLSINDFKNHKLLLFENQEYYPPEIFERTKPALVSTSMKLLYELAKSGYGIAALPSSHLQQDDLYGNRLVQVIKGMQCSSSLVYFITRETSSKLYLLESLYNMAQEVYS